MDQQLDSIMERAQSADAQTVEVKRELYLLNGLVEALMQWCETCTLQLNLTGRLSAVALSALLDNCSANQMDSVLSGFLRRIAQILDHTRCLDMHELACHVLTMCICNTRQEAEEEGDNKNDQVRVAFFREPGVIDALLRKGDVRMTLFMLAALAKTISEEMLAAPRVVNYAVRETELEDGGWMYEANKALDITTALVRNGPLRALAHPQIIHLFVSLVRGDKRGFESAADARNAAECLARWQMALCGRAAVPIAPDWDFSEHALCTFWRNVPRLWTAISTPRLKSRSPLRRLPGEMFRLLKDTLCGYGST